jgi:hypothetical protein
MDNTKWLDEITQLEERVAEKYGSAVVAVVNYIRINDELKNDTDLSLIAVTGNSDNAKYLPEHMKTTAFCNKAYQLNPNVFPHLADKLSYDVVMDALKATPDIFDQLPDNLKIDRKFCLDAVVQNPEVFRHLDNYHQSDKLIAFHAINGDSATSPNLVSPYQENLFLLGIKLKGELFAAGATEFDAAKKYLSSATLLDKLTANLPKKPDQRQQQKLKI